MFWFGIGLLFLGGAVVYHYWREIKNWFASVLEEVAKIVRKLGQINPEYEYTTEVVALLLEGTAAMIKHTSCIEQADGNFEMKTTTAKVPRSELPASIRNKLRRAGDIVGKEVDAEREMKLEVGM